MMRALGLALLVVIAVALRTWGAGGESLDPDEMFSLNVAALPLPRGMAVIEKDLVHPPLFYLLLAGVTAVHGASPNVVRLLPLISGILTILAVAVFGEVFPSWRGPALIAALLLTVNDSHIFFSQQARSYSLYTLCITALIGWAWLIDKASHRKLYWAAGTFIMTLCLYTHYVAGVYVAAVLLAICLAGHSLADKAKSLAAGAVASLAFLPWLLIEYSVYRSSGAGVNSKGISWQELPSFSFLRTLVASFWGIPDVRGGTTMSLLVAASALSLVLFARHGGLEKFKITVLFFTAFLPIVAVFAVSFRPLSMPIFANRHLLPSIVPALLLTGAAICQARMRFGKAAAFLVILLFTGLQLSATIKSIENLPRRFPYIKLAHYLRGHNPRQFPVYTTWQYGIGNPVNYYCGRVNVKELPADKELPREFIVLYREKMTPELARISRLAQDGYKVEALKVFSHTGESECRSQPSNSKRLGRTCFLSHSVWRSVQLFKP